MAVRFAGLILFLEFSMFSRNHLVVFSLSLVALLMVGCGGGDGSVALPIPEGPTYSIPDSTTVIPPEDYPENRSARHGCSADGTRLHG